MLQTRLAELFPDATCEIIHGDIDLEGRRQARIRFEKASRFLLSTEAGGEGDNLHRTCPVMVNYDLPSNPMPIQHHIGRLDRYDQKEVDLVFNRQDPEPEEHV